MIRRSALRWLLAGVVAVAGVGLAAPSRAEVYDLGGGQGQLDYALWGNLAVPNTPTEDYAPIRYDYLVYKPVGWKKQDQLPVYVLLHGCGTTANQMMGSTLLNRVADRERFLVVYPDNQGNCWHAVSEDGSVVVPGTGGNITRGAGGEVDIIAGITRKVTAQYNGDADRVYLMGMSAGAFQTSATAAAYPEIYAAVGSNAGGGPGMATPCIGYPDAVVPHYARRGLAAMGSRARVMPYFAIGGTEDQLGEYQHVGGCVRLAHMEWLYIDNMLNPLSGTVEPGASVLLPAEARAAAGRLDTYQDDPTSTAAGQVPNGWAWTKKVARDPKGCQITEEWVVNGMGHYWSGGSTNPKYTNPQTTPTGGEAPGFNDPRGPSASEASWNFFKTFSLKNGNTTCRKK